MAHHLERVQTFPLLVAPRTSRAAPIMPSLSPVREAYGAF
jgi:hypothetical protein